MLQLKGYSLLLSTIRVQANYLWRHKFRKIYEKTWSFLGLRTAVDSLIHLQLFYCYHLLQFLFMAAEFFNSSDRNSGWNSHIVTSQVRTIICKAENLVRYMRAAVAFLSCLSASGLAMWKTHVHYGTTETLKSFGVTSLKYSEKNHLKKVHILF